MSRLIDKGTLKSVIRNKFPDLADRIQINNIINEQPTIDAVERTEYEKMKDLAEQYKFEYECIFEDYKDIINNVLPNRVEVVRCENCKYYVTNYAVPYCGRTLIGMKKSDYCSFGERKNDGNN